MEDILIVQGHPESESLTSALATAYQRGSGGRLLSLCSLRFDPILRRSDQALEPDLEHAREAIVRAKHIAWFFPTWWSAPPALVKGFIDRVFTPGFAYRYVEGRALHERLLLGRSARFVTTMDAPWWWYRAVYHRSLHASFVNGTLRYVGFGPVHTNTLHGVRTMSCEQRSAAIARMEAVGSTDARTTGAPTSRAKRLFHRRPEALAEDCIPLHPRSR